MLQESINWPIQKITITFYCSDKRSVEPHGDLASMLVSWLFNGTDTNVLNWNFNFVTSQICKPWYLGFLAFWEKPRLWARSYKPMLM